MTESILVGLGSIGTSVARELGSSLLAAAEITGNRPELGVPITKTIADARAAAPRAKVAVLTTSSRLTEIVPQVEQALAEGLHVVSTCEELAYPALRRPDLAETMDRAAQKAGRVVIGVGVNPGFVLDLLPVVTSHACVRVESVEAERIVDITQRRAQLRRKVGEGLTEAKWRALAAEGKMGHVGLAESAALLATGLGWPPGDVKETLEPVLGEAGARGQFQTAVAAGGRVTLRLEMAADAAGPRDHIRIQGDPPIDVILAGGIQGDRGTVGTVLHAIRRVESLAPGLRTVLDL
jgi:4-hydroxy-tetrahydrodipicolinate reductase